MGKTYLFLLAIAPFLALQAAPASACVVVGHTKDGERLCMTSSDGAGQAYRDGRRPKAVQAMEIAHRRAATLEILKRRFSH